MKRFTMKIGNQSIDFTEADMESMDSALTGAAGQSPQTPASSDPGRGNGTSLLADRLKNGSASAHAALGFGLGRQIRGRP